MSVAFCGQSARSSFPFYILILRGHLLRGCDCMIFRNVEEQLSDEKRVNERDLKRRER